MELRARRKVPGARLAAAPPPQIIGTATAQADVRLLIQDAHGVGEDTDVHDQRALHNR